MKFKNLLGFVSFLFSVLSMAGCHEKPVRQVSPYYMDRSFPDLAQTWDEGIPLGNAMLGALVWQRKAS